jgi:acyl carrier protein
MENHLKEIFSEVLEVEETDLNDDFGPDDCPLWDSMNNLRLITAIEEEFGVKFSMEEIATMVNFGEVKAVLSLHVKNTT